MTPRTSPLASMAGTSDRGSFVMAILPCEAAVVPAQRHARVYSPEPTRTKPIRRSAASRTAPPPLAVEGPLQGHGAVNLGGHEHGQTGCHREDWGYRRWQRRGSWAREDVADDRNQDRALTSSSGPRRACFRKLV